MRKQITNALPALVALALAAQPARAWEDKGHMLVNRLAAESMPDSTPAFFKNAVARLEYLGPEPDRWKIDGGAQLAAASSPEHYLDMEPLAGLELPADRFKFIAMLETKGLLAKHQMANDKLGFLPYRIAELTQTLQSQWRDWQTVTGKRQLPRFDDGTEPPLATAEQLATAQTQIEQNIINTAGILGHYVADAANPHHTSVHHNGWDQAFQPNPAGYTTSEDERKKVFYREGRRLTNGFHHRFEGVFVDAAIQAAEVKPLIAPVKPVGNTFDDAMAFIKASNARLVPLYEMEKQDAFNVSGAVKPDARRFAQERLAAGASMLRDLWSHAIKGVEPRRRQPRATTPASGAPANAAPATPAPQSQADGSN